MLKWARTSLISFAAAAVVGFVLVLLGAPKPLVILIIMVYMAYRSNNRPVTNVTPLDRDRLLAQGPPANYGLVYVHRGLGVGGLLVGFNVKLDNEDVALLKVVRFTRLVVAPGSHQLVVGPKNLSAHIAEKQTAEASFAITAGETAVFGLNSPKGKMILRKLELDRELDIPTALAKLAQVKMVASEQRAGLTQTTARPPGH
jgi:hypothetical protein